MGDGRLPRPLVLATSSSRLDLAGFDLVQRLADSVSVGQDLEDPTNEFCAVLSGAERHAWIVR